MPGEITVSLSVVGSKAGATASAVDSDVVDMAGANMSSQTVTVGVASAAFSIGAVTRGGILVIKNLSTTATVYVSAGTAAITAIVGPPAIPASPIKIAPGETVLLRSNGLVAYEAIASAAATLIQVVCFDA